MCMTQLWHVISNGTGMKEMSTNTHHHKNCSKKQPLNSLILPPKCAERAFSRLLMSPMTSPNDHSPVKPPCSIEFNETVEESDSNIDNTEGIISDAVMLIDDKNN